MKGLQNLIKLDGDRPLVVFQDNEIRTVIYNGEPLFDAFDIGKILGLNAYGIKSVLRQMNDNQRIVLTNKMIESCLSKTTLKLANRGATFLREAGVYAMVLNSRKPEAVALKDWITDDVIPTINRTGGYVHDTDKFVEAYFGSVEDDVKNIIKILLEDRRRMEKELLDARPKVELCNTILMDEPWLILRLPANDGPLVGPEVLEIFHIFLADLLFKQPEVFIRV